MVDKFFDNNYNSKNTDNVWNFTVGITESVSQILNYKGETYTKVLIVSKNIKNFFDVYLVNNDMELCVNDVPESALLEGGKIFNMLGSDFPEVVLDILQAKIRVA